MENNSLTKPLLRGHFHQSAFFVAVGACLMLVTEVRGARQFAISLIYSFSLTALLGISALYHRPQWSPNARTWMRRLDHAAIFILIAGTATPICLLGIQGEAGKRLLTLICAAGVLGIIQSLFWVHAPKWLTAIFYVGVGCLSIPYFPEASASLSPSLQTLILAGGAAYILGALVYAIKRPNPWPRVFGYHEIFHILVIVAALLHFLVVDQLLSAAV